MKANELQLGDWVLDTEFGRNRPARVETIEPHRVWLEGGKTYTPIACIAPIPLTTEILEKNFEREDKPYWNMYCYLTEYFEKVVITEYVNRLWKITVDEERMGNLLPFRACVTNVHELQNALRLCGAGKEIEV